MLNGKVKLVKAVSVGEIAASTLTVEVEVGRIPDELFTWIQDAFATGGDATRSGEVRLYSPDYQTAGIRTFHNARISRVTFPALDGGIHGHLTVDFVAESMDASQVDTQGSPELPGEERCAQFYFFPECIEWRASAYRSCWACRFGNVGKSGRGRGDLGH